MTENYYALTRLADAGRAGELRRAERDRLALAVTRAASRHHQGLRGRAGVALVRLALLLDGTTRTVPPAGEANAVRPASA